MPDGMPNGRQHLYRRSIPLARPAIRHLNIQNIGTATVLMQHDCIRTVRRGSGGIMPLYMIRTHFQWIGRRMTLRPSRDVRPFNDRVVHNRNPISGKRNYLGFFNFREKMQQSRFDIINHGEPLVLRYRSN